jgi:hypothetical protein
LLTNRTCTEVFVHLVDRQSLSGLVVAEQPEPRCLVELVVSDIQVVSSNVFDLTAAAGFGLFVRNVFRLFVDVDSGRVEHPALYEGLHVNGFLVILVITVAGSGT